MEPKYSIPYLPEEQSRLQFAKNCIDSLSQLELVMDNIFTCITLRITDSSKKVTKLKARADAAQKKIDQLKGRSTATQVFCSSNFPGRTDYEPFKCLFNETDKIFSSLKKYDDVAIEPYSVADKWQPLPVIYKHKKQLHKRTENRSGIGKLPNHISSTASLLLYNTQYNLYENYTQVDPLSVNYESRLERKKSMDQKLLADAPMSITNDHDVNFVAKDEFHYLPDLTELPEFDLPLELSSLPGIANDLLYEGDAGPHIAPSYFLPDLPQELQEVTEDGSTDVAKGSFDKPVDVKESICGSDVADAKIEEEVIHRKVQTPPASIPPPPPLPEALMTPAAPPAPPPPPPPPPSILPVTRTSQNNQNVSLPDPINSDSRSNLMKAIQQAGGTNKAKLRKVSKIDDTVKKPAKTGEYMADLFSKLAQRRKGISGGGNKENDPKPDLSKLSTLQQMSVLIPPAPKSGDDTDEVSEDDWD